MLFAPHGSNNPSRYTDPTGHCSTDRKGDDYCPGYSGASTPIRAEQIRRENAKYQDDCAAGRNSACPGGTVGMLAQGAGMIATAGAADYALTGGAAADAGWAALSKIAVGCASNAVCWRVATALGILGGYPPNHGFASPPTTTTLHTGQIITRYGLNTGEYASPIGTTLPQRALQADIEMPAISGFEVMKPIENVWMGVTRGWYGQPGGGTQFFFGAGRTIQSLIDSGHLLELP